MSFASTLLPHLTPAYPTQPAVWRGALIVYWASLMIPAFGVLVAWRTCLHSRRWSGWRRFAATVLIGGSALLSYMRFVEPQHITVQETHLPLGVSLRIALVSDTHLGVFKGPGYLRKLVTRLNELPVDVVLVAGDHTYLPDRPLAELLQPWSQSRHPVYSVPGNHDEQRPGPPLARALYDALRANWVHPVEYTHADLGPAVLVGLGDHYAQRDGLQPLQAAPAGKPVIVLMHQPDSARQLPRGSAALALAGHTHGGQIRIEWLLHAFVPWMQDFDRGYYRNLAVPLYITTGVGESHLPLRLMVPPVIDVLDLH